MTEGIWRDASHSELRFPESRSLRQADLCGISRSVDEQRTRFLEYLVEFLGRHFSN